MNSMMNLLTTKEDRAAWDTLMELESVAPAFAAAKTPLDLAPVIAAAVEHMVGHAEETIDALNIVESMQDMEFDEETKCADRDRIDWHARNVRQTAWIIDADFYDNSTCGNAMIRLELSTYRVVGIVNRAECASNSEPLGVNSAMYTHAIAELIEAFADIVDTIWDAVHIMRLIVNIQKQMRARVMQELQVKVCLPPIWMIHEELAMAIFHPDKMRAILERGEEMLEYLM